MSIQKTCIAFAAIVSVLILAACAPAVTTATPTSGSKPGTATRDPMPPAPRTPTALYQVDKVVDGDTIDVALEGKTERVRLVGIDAPESVDPRQPVECFGKEAANKAKELLEGKKVRMDGDPSQGDRDRFGRLLRYVWLEDGRFANLELIAQGYAHEYTFDKPYLYQLQFKEAERAAQEQHRGFWAADTCSGNTAQPAR